MGASTPCASLVRTRMPLLRALSYLKTEIRMATAPLFCTHACHMRTSFDFLYQTLLVCLDYLVPWYTIVNSTERLAQSQDISLFPTANTGKVKMSIYSIQQGSVLGKCCGTCLFPSIQQEYV